MYLCYLDASGDPGVGAGSPTPYYVVNALFISADEWPAIFDDVVAHRRWLKAQFGLLMREELKGSQLASGSGVWRRRRTGDRVRHAIYRSVMRLEANLATKYGAGSAFGTFSVAVDKASKASKDDVLRTAWEFTLQRLERQCSKTGERVLLLPDDGETQHLTPLARRMRRFNRPGSAFGSGSLARPFSHLVEDPAERHSHRSYFIQLADLNAYAAYRVLAPVTPFPSNMWDRLGPALHTPVNRLSGGPQAIVLA